MLSEDLLDDITYLHRAINAGMFGIPAEEVPALHERLNRLTNAYVELTENHEELVDIFRQLELAIFRGFAAMDETDQVPLYDTITPVLENNRAAIERELGR